MVSKINDIGYISVARFTFPNTLVYDKKIRRFIYLFITVIKDFYIFLRGKFVFIQICNIFTILNKLVVKH